MAATARPPPPAAASPTAEAMASDPPRRRRPPTSAPSAPRRRAARDPAPGERRHRRRRRRPRRRRPRRRRAAGGGDGMRGAGELRGGAGAPTARARVDRSAQSGRRRVSVRCRGASKLRAGGQGEGRVRELSEIEVREKRGEHLGSSKRRAQSEAERAERKKKRATTLPYHHPPPPHSTHLPFLHTSRPRLPHEGGAPFRAGSRLARTAGRASRAPCTAGSLCSFIANKVELSQKR